jgi:hypothetical protein
MELMAGVMRFMQLGILFALAAAPAGAQRAPSVDKTLSAISLSAPFSTSSAWDFSATQGPPVDQVIGSEKDQIPGVIHLCLRHTGRAACSPQLDSRIGDVSGSDFYSQPHYLRQAKIVRTASGRPLLSVQVGGPHSGDGDQGIFTQVLAYHRSADQFVRIYSHVTGSNNNQEVRYVETTPLKGDIVSAEPTEKAPFGFWITVNVFTSAETYKQVLRYRSATIYSDGNPLSVIDSEMPNIERRLGLWRPGQPTPLPVGSCPKPHMIGMELWCR